MTLIVAACIALSDPAIPSSFAQAKDDKRVKQLETEKRKLDTTKDPANRAESLMKIADITLTYVGDAITAKDLPKMESYVEQFRRSVTDAREVMMTSGLDPYKKPKGYKTVELATRKHLRLLEDSARRLAPADRRVLDEAIEAVSQIHTDFLRTIFR